MRPDVVEAGRPITATNSSQPKLHSLLWRHEPLLPDCARAQLSAVGISTLFL